MTHRLLEPACRHRLDVCRSCPACGACFVHEHGTTAELDAAFALTHITLAQWLDHPDLPICVTAPDPLISDAALRRFLEVCLSAFYGAPATTSFTSRG